MQTLTPHLRNPNPAPARESIHWYGSEQLLGLDTQGRWVFVCLWCNREYLYLPVRTLEQRAAPDHMEYYADGWPISEALYHRLLAQGSWTETPTVTGEGV